MRIKFANGFDEFSEGNKDYLKQNEPFEVADGERFLAITAKVRTGGKLVRKNVFEAAEKTPAAAAAEPVTVETLVKKSREQLETMAKEAGLDGNTYTSKAELAAAILAAGQGDQ